MSWYNPNRPGSGKGKGASRRGGRGEPYFRPRAPKVLPGAKPEDGLQAAPPPDPAGSPPAPQPGESRPPAPRPPDEPGRDGFR